MKSKSHSHNASPHLDRLQAFTQRFNALALHRHRYTVFGDFVTLCAINLHNVCKPTCYLEEEYTTIAKGYSLDEMQEMSALLGLLVELLEPMPQDILGQLYMALDLGNANTGQFFTPDAISLLMAKMTMGEVPETGFMTMCEPACGAGGMVLAAVKCLIDAGHNPAQKLWVQCQDIDRMVALMCYVQLALWNVPAVVIVGDTLTNEARERFYTPAHILGRWDYKLSKRFKEADKPLDPVRPVAADGAQFKWIFNLASSN